MSAVPARSAPICVLAVAAPPPASAAPTTKVAQPTHAVRRPVGATTNQASVTSGATSIPMAATQVSGRVQSSGSSGGTTVAEPDAGGDEVVR